MLSCDLLYAADGLADTLILVSADDDFLPPIRTAILRGTKVIRFRPKKNTQCTFFPYTDLQLLDMEL